MAASRRGSRGRPGDGLPVGGGAMVGTGVTTPYRNVRWWPGSDPAPRSVVAARRRRVPRGRVRVPRSMRRLALLLTAFVLAGCGGGHEPADEAAAPAATASPAATAAPDAGGAAPFIGSLTVDPGDGTVVAGTGLGAYRLEPGAKRG